MLSEDDEENSIYHSILQIIRRTGTERAMSSIIKSGQKDTEASIHKHLKDKISVCVMNF